MCGFAGFIDTRAVLTPAEWVNTLNRMGESIAHRGPDDHGIWLDQNTGIGLSHQRLAILDLSQSGHQPMISPSGRYVIVFNGEIYNHLDLRKEVDDYRWQGHSDTETLLAGFELWGIRETLEKTVGMFAFAVWNREDRVLTLARDRIGEKPLYYGIHNNVFLFGSELKALRQHPAFESKVDRNGLALYLRYCYVPAPYSIYQGVFKLLPGTMIHISELAKGLSEPIPYWTLKDTVVKNQATLFDGSDEEAISELEIKILEAVRTQQISDVPLGAFLSGGIDSSTIVALMQSSSARPVRTFTIGFKERGYNEAEHAKAVAKHLGTEHTELYVTPEQARTVIPGLPTIYDEPFSDSSQIPTFLVSQMARGYVTVSLSGDAGDELFGGYNRYKGWVTKTVKYPLLLRKMIAHGITTLSPPTWNQMGNAVASLLPKSMQYALPGDKAHKLAAILEADSLASIYRGLVSTWTDGGIIAGKDTAALFDHFDEKWDGIGASEHHMMAFDAITYLPDDILVKVDRAAMAVSLETRVPFLDHRVVEFAWRLPLSMKIRNGQGKWILRQILYKYVPKELVERPKMGFGVPIDSWLRGPLKGWAEELLNESRLKKEGFLNSMPIRKKWEEHLSGQRNWQYHLWNILMFQSWLEQWKAS